MTDDELLSAFTEAMRVLREMHDFGEPTQHYRDRARGVKAWDDAADLLARFHDEAWLMADYESESRGVDDE